MRTALALAIVLLTMSSRADAGDDLLAHVNFERGGEPAGLPAPATIVGKALMSSMGHGRALVLAVSGGERAFVDFGDAPALRFGADRDFTVGLWTKVDVHRGDAQPIISNRDGDQPDGPGWALTVTADGVWSWTVSDGSTTLDYTPTFARQNVTDRRWHHLAFSVNRSRAEARLYRDGVNVAVYSIQGLGDLTSGLPTCVGADGTRGRSKLGTLGGTIDDIRIWGRALGDEEIESLWRARYPMPARPELTPDHVKVMAWNIWHGGREDGERIGVQRTIEAIRASGADIVCMQETYGSGPTIADALGFRLYLRSSNLSILTRFHIGETYALYEPFRFGGARIRLSDGRALDVFSLWINHLPDYWGAPPGPETTAAELIAGEQATRGAEIRGILHALAPRLARTDGVPVVVAGDFNSNSHLDWTAATADRHHGRIVEWPVSKAMQDAGFVDGYRTVRPDPRTHPGRTWSPRFPDQAPGRIDYVYGRGPALTPTHAVVLDEHEPRWPSDHAAVVVTYRLEAATPAAP